MPRLGSPLQCAPAREEPRHPSCVNLPEITPGLGNLSGGLGGGTCCGLGMCFCLRNSPQAGHPQTQRRVCYFPFISSWPCLLFCSLRLSTPPDRPFCTLTPCLLPQGAGFAGFLWDTAAGVELRDAAWQESSPGNGHGKPVGPSPYLARFKVSLLLLCGATLSEKEKSPL